MQMNWAQLLSSKRCPRSAGGEFKLSNKERHRSAFESDWDRIAFSTPFRRLARKTQVHPLVVNDHVHTRLTHSLEVASVGRSFGRRLTKYLAAKKLLPSHLSELDIVFIIQAACLAHDIGNPPFGHAGEDAIRQWVESHKEDIFPCKVCVSEAVQNDLLFFEGNAQGFRLAARGDNPKTGYMRLTIATLGAMIKYPWDSCDDRVSQKKKYNIFSTEKELFLGMAKELGIHDKSGQIHRHPLSFLTEAADDICYRILDLEDAVEMRILDETKVRKVFGKILGHDEDLLPVFRGAVIGSLIDQMWDIFDQDYQRIMSGQRTADLKSDLPRRIQDGLRGIEQLYTTIFSEPSKVAAELGAYKALGRILKAFCYATKELSYKQEFDKCPPLSKKCLQLGWGAAYVKEHQQETYEWWLHQTTDFISGLTDNYARQLSREIEGT